MTTQDPSRLECPDDVMLWIPWYPGPGLSDDQKAAVETHVAGCSRCRDELDLVIGGPVSDVSAAPGLEVVYERVMTLIEEDSVRPPREDDRTDQRPGRSRAPASRRGRGYATWQQALAIAIVAGMAGLIVGFSFGGFEGEPVYRTAATVERGGADGGILEVVFREEATAKQIQRALRALGARVVSGPSEEGVMRLALPPESDAEAVALLLQAEDLGIALFAQPQAAEPGDAP